MNKIKDYLHWECHEIWLGNGEGEDEKIIR